MSQSGQRRRVLAVSSGGGHWLELLRLRGALRGNEVGWVTCVRGYRCDLEEADRFFVVTDVTRWNKLKWIWCVLQLLMVMIRFRPEVVLSTGAMPGYFAVRLGKLLGLRTVWVDSIANADELSRSGQLAGRFVDLWLTQWEHLSHPRGPLFRGSVL